MQIRIRYSARAEQQLQEQGRVMFTRYRSTDGLTPQEREQEVRAVVQEFLVALADLPARRLPDGVILV